MEEFTSIFDAVDQFEATLLDISRLKESILWRKALRIREAASDKEKSILNFDGKQLLARVELYSYKLESYRANYDFYDNTNTIQEKDLQFTTDKFFMEVVAPVREKAIDALNQLSKMILSSKVSEDKKYLTIAYKQTITNLNNLIDACIRMLELNKPTLINNLKNKGIDFKEKYNLKHITLSDLDLKLGGYNFE